MREMKIDYGLSRTGLTRGLAARRSLALGLGRYNRSPSAVRGGYASQFARCVHPTRPLRGGRII